MSVIAYINDSNPCRSDRLGRPVFPAIQVDLRDVERNEGGH